MDVNVQMDDFEELSIKHIELRGVNGKNISAVTEEEALKIKKEFDKRGFKASAIGSPVGKVDITVPNEGEVRKLRHIVNLAKIFGTKYIRIFSPFIPEGGGPREYRDEVMFRMRDYLNEVKSDDLILLHENEGGYIYGQAPENCLDLIESMGSEKLKATYDPGNFVYAGYDALKSYTILRDYIEYVHIKDSAGIGSVVPAGMGQVQYPEILKDLKSQNRHFFLTHEPHLVEFEGFAEIDNSKRKFTGGNPKEMFFLAFNNFEKIIELI